MAKSVKKTFRGEGHNDWNRGRIKGTGNSSNVMAAPIPSDVINDLLAYFDFGIGTDNHGGFSEVADTGSASELFRKMSMRAPLAGICFVDDFHTADYSESAGAMWLLTLTDGGGDNGETITTGVSQIVSTTNDADNDCNFFQLCARDQNGAIAPYALVENDGKPAYFEISVNLTDATNQDFLFGIGDVAGGADAVTTGITDGVYFQKPAADTQLDFHVAKDGTTTDASDLGDLADGTDVILGFSWDGVGTIKAYRNGVLVSTVVDMDNLPDDVQLCPFFGHQNGGAAAEIADFNHIIMYQDA